MRKLFEPTMEKSTTQRQIKNADQKILEVILQKFKLSKNFSWLKMYQIILTV